MIPKIIHYCWFGRGEKPELVQRCIESWRKFCPDYEIVEWNEDNFDINICQYTREAYRAKKWAFVSDLARLIIVYENGGIYLDTDVELKRGLDDLCSYNAWFAQDDIRYINTGLGFGSCKNFELLKAIIDKRTQRTFDMTICNAIDTPIIRDYLGIKQRRESQKCGDVYIVGMIDYGIYARHHESNSWKSDQARAFAHSRKNRFWKLKCFLRNPTLINFLERTGETTLSKIYIFLLTTFWTAVPSIL